MKDFIYFLVDRANNTVRIGYTTGADGRIRSHFSSSSSLEIHGIICGRREHEARLHRWFTKRGLLNNGSKNTSDYRVEGEMTVYLNRIASALWATDSMDDAALQSIWEDPRRFPWQSRVYEMGFGGIDESGQFDVGLRLALKRPQTRDARIKATHRTGDDEYYTPPLYIEAARRVMGDIDLDPASSPQANCVVRAVDILTEQLDGLQYHWAGRVWLNPPFSKSGDFVGKLLADYHRGDVTQAIICVNNNASDTMWFQPLFQFYRCVAHHRPDFNPAGTPGKKASSPSKGTYFVYLGDNIDDFVYEFTAFGDVQPPSIPARITAKHFRRHIKPLAWDTEVSLKGPGN
jgi:ParB family chromosome partitioning protein